MDNVIEENLLDLSKSTLKRRRLENLQQIKLAITDTSSSIASSTLKSLHYSHDTAADDNESDSESEQSECSSDGRNSDDSMSSKSDDETDYDTDRLDWMELDTIADLLRDLFVDYNSCAPFVSRLLTILNKAGLNYLPKTYETFMKTEEHQYEIEKYREDKGSYLHFGLEKGLVAQLSKLKAPPEQNCINININIDGIPITKSSGSQFWPILGLSDIPELVDPFEIGIFHSPTKKPKTTQFLNSFIDEAIKLTKSGLIFLDKTFKFNINLFINDTPANSFMLHIVSHTGYECCRKCAVYGLTLHNRRCFPDLDCELRTDSSFRNEIFPGHHKGKSPLLKLDIDMINSVPLDYMHLVCLGVTKKLILFWVTAIKRGPKRLSGEKNLLLEQKLYRSRSSQPTEFSRRIRTTQEIKHWKATELRTFVLYVGPIVLKDVLPQREYHHFMKLHCAMQILIKDENLLYLQEAQNLLVEFVQEMLLVEQPLYGNHFVGYNFHNLIHLVEDVRLHGKLDNFSSFPFENRLQFLKSKLRGANNPLQQIANRLAELKEFKIGKHTLSNLPLLSQPKIISRDGEKLTVYLKITMKDFVIDNSPKNKWYMSNNFEIYSFSYATKINNTICLNGHKAKSLENFYANTLLFDSRLLNISQSSCIATTLSVIQIENFNTKVFCLKSKNNNVFFPL
jgi:hypothetical protein